MKNNLVITIIIAFIVAAAAFYGGMMYQKSQVPAGGQFGQAGRNGQRRLGNGGATIGQVVSQDANSITLKLADGSSKIINISGSTTVSKTDTAAMSDVKAGERIAAFGTTNSDGSITAQNIQLNPQQMRGGFGGSPRPTQ